MEPMEGMAYLRGAFNEGHFSGNVMWFKYADGLGKGAHRDERNFQSVERLCCELVGESRAEIRFTPAFSGLCIRLSKLCSLPNWGLNVVGRAQIQCRTLSAGERNKGMVAIMVRERMPCRRGPERGESSRPPAADVHHHCCYCYCYRRMGATPIPACQVLEVGSSSGGEPKLPAFGSVTFSLGSSGDNPGINAHISVLFTQIQEENAKESSLVLAKDNSARGKGKLPMGEPSTEAEGSASGRGKLPVEEPASEEGNSGTERSQSTTQHRAPEQPEPAHNPTAMEAEPED